MYLLLNKKKSRRIKDDNKIFVILIDMLIFFVVKYLDCKLL